MLLPQKIRHKEEGVMHIITTIRVKRKRTCIAFRKFSPTFTYWAWFYANALQKSELCPAVINFANNDE